MTHQRFTSPTCGLILGAALTAACGDAPTVSIPEPSFALTTAVLVVWPDMVELRDGEQQQFVAYACPPDVNGDPLLGPDGVPGTDDDDCVPVTAFWGVEGDIGSIDATGTLTAVLPDGSGLETGIVRATSGGMSAEADVTVVGGDDIGDKDKEKNKYKPCVQFTQDGKPVGDKVCMRNVPLVGNTTARIGFTPGKDFKVKVGSKSETAPEKATRLHLTLDLKQGKVDGGVWKGETGFKDIKVEKLKGKAAHGSFPRGSDGEIRSFNFGSQPVPLPRDDENNPIRVNDVHVTFEELST